MEFRMVPLSTLAVAPRARGPRHRRGVRTRRRARPRRASTSRSTRRCSKRCRTRCCTCCATPSITASSRPRTRAAAGKPPRGRIVVRAFARRHRRPDRGGRRRARARSGADSPRRRSSAGYLPEADAAALATDDLYRLRVPAGLHAPPIASARSPAAASAWTSSRPRSRGCGGRIHLDLDAGATARR